jgi:hypothetical protein
VPHELTDKSAGTTKFLEYEALSKVAEHDTMITPIVGLQGKHVRAICGQILEGLLTSLLKIFVLVPQNSVC